MILKAVLVSVLTNDTFSAQGAWKRGSNCPNAIRRQFSMTSWLPQAIAGPDRPGAAGAPVCDRLKPPLRRARSSIPNRITNKHIQSRLQAGAPAAFGGKSGFIRAIRAIRWQVPISAFPHKIIVKLTNSLAKTVHQAPILFISGFWKAAYKFFE